MQYGINGQLQTLSAIVEFARKRYLPCVRVTPRLGIKGLRAVGRAANHSSDY
jgi:hypothetical protein